jgi:membrane protein required for beta-lactamase induction
MIFVAVLIALGLDALLRAHQPMQGYRGLRSALAAFSTRAEQENGTMATLSVLAVSVVPALAIGLLLGLVAGHSRLLSLVLDVFVLVLALAPRDLPGEIAAYREALDAGDEARARELARELLGHEPQSDLAARTDEVTEFVLVGANDRLFGVFFWFALLGPAGAVLYRMMHLLHDECRGGEGAFCAAAERGYGVLAWLPAHLTALAYGLAGSFEDAATDFREYYSQCSVQFFQVNSDVLACTGRGALRLAAGSDHGLARVDAAMALVKRSLLIWMVALALVSLIGWIA